MSRILAIDPGPVESAYVFMDGDEIVNFGKEESSTILRLVQMHGKDADVDLAVENVASYGMAVGKEVFETCIWIGRFIQAFGRHDYRLIYRLDVKTHLCHDSRAKDSNIRQALIDRFGGPQECKKGGKLYGIKADIWSALAVAVTYADMQEGRE